MNRPVSIIIPCYNAGPFLRETLDSAVCQTVPAEVILVDDGSTDDSAAIARSFGPPVRVLQQANQGESVAMNAALAIAKGELIVFLGADDILHPQLLEAQLSALGDAPNAVACTGFAFFLNDISQAFHPTMPRADAFFPEIVRANLGPPSCWMFPKHLILQAGCFHGPQRYFEDWDLNWRVGMTGATYVPVNMIGFYYRQHAKSQLASLSSPERAYGHAWLMERMCRAFLERPDLLQAHGATLFWSALAALRASRAHGVSWQRLRLLGGMIDEVARRQPPDLRRSSFSRVVQWLGVRRTEEIHSLWRGGAVAPSYRPPWLPESTGGVSRSKKFVA